MDDEGNGRMEVVDYLEERVKALEASVKALETLQPVKKRVLIVLFTKYKLPDKAVMGLRDILANHGIEAVVLDWNTQSSEQVQVFGLDNLTQAQYDEIKELVEFPRLRSLICS